ncbi:MAG: DUF6941 family protein [Solirubrobacteraceae bacterium]
MNIAFLLLTDHSESLNGKLYAMGAGWNILRFPELPFDFAFGIALGLDVEWNETNQRHVLELEVLGPDGERLGERFRLEFEAGRPAGVIEGQDQRMVLSLGTRNTFEATGPHSIRVFIDGEEAERTRFYVICVPQLVFPGGQPPG